VLEKMVAQQPNERYGDGMLARAAIDQLLVASQPQPPTIPSPEASTQQSQPRAAAPKKADVSPVQPAAQRVKVKPQASIPSNNSGADNLGRRKLLKFLGFGGSGLIGTLLLAQFLPKDSTTTVTSSTDASKTGKSADGKELAAPAAGANGLETTKARLGFIVLTDSSPVIIALEKGLFKKYGMTEVEVVKQSSWPVTLDNLEIGPEGGGIDGAHIPSPLPYLMVLGKTKSKQPLPMYILARLNTNGQAISIASSYKDAKITLKSANLKEVLAKAKAGGKTDLKAAMTFLGGTHDLWMRYWLSANGVDPNKDVTVIRIPPSQMVSNMKAGTVEMFCVGEPWNNQLVNNKIGSIATTTGEIWADHPGKSLCHAGSVGR
jgi:ABC-type nitrate/sulfonate/bicarbonate transport system substrate-binding protein